MSAPCFGFVLAATDVINPAINAAAGGFGEGGNIDEEAESGVLRAAKRERKARIRAMRGKSGTPPNPAMAVPWRLCCCRRVSLPAHPIYALGSTPFKTLMVYHGTLRM